jgi:hypothetical protein
VSRAFSSIQMIQECIEGKRVYMGGLYQDRKTGEQVVVTGFVAGPSTLYWYFQPAFFTGAGSSDSLSTKKFVKRFTLVGV